MTECISAKPLPDPCHLRSCTKSVSRQYENESENEGENEGGNECENEGGDEGGGIHVMEVGQRAAVAGNLWVQRRFCVYELLLTKEKFYEGTKGLCLHEDGYRSSGMDRAPIPWIVFSYHGSRGRPSPSGLALGRWHGCVHNNTTKSKLSHLYNRI